MLPAWLNNCVGHFNHRYFFSFCLYMTLGCIYCSISSRDLFLDAYSAIEVSEDETGGGGECSNLGESLTPLSSIGVAISTSRTCPVQGRGYDDIFHSEVPARWGERAESELGRQTTGETQDLITIFALSSQMYLIQDGLISNTHQLFNSSTASSLSKLSIVSFNTPRSISVSF